MFRRRLNLDYHRLAVCAFLPFGLIAMTDKGLLTDGMLPLWFMVVGMCAQGAASDERTVAAPEVLLPGPVQAAGALVRRRGLVGEVPPMTATTTGGSAVPPRRPIRVLMALAPPDGSTRYVDQITAEAPPEVSFTYRTWRSAFTGRYDVFHVHWPEFLVQAKNPLTSVGRGVLLLVLLARLRAGRVAIVRTLHNLAAHEDEGSRWQRWLLAVLYGRTTLFIRINSATELDTAAPVVTIPHGHYRDRFAAMGKRDPQPKRLLYFGLIRGYKGIDSVLDLVAGAADPELTLRIVGKPLSDAVVDQIRRAAERDRADHRATAIRPRRGPGRRGDRRAGGGAAVPGDAQLRRRAGGAVPGSAGGRPAHAGERGPGRRGGAGLGLHVRRRPDRGGRRPGPGGVRAPGAPTARPA